MTDKNDVVFKNLMMTPIMNVKVHGITKDDFFQKKNYSGIFGIDGGKDVSPRISWSNFPKETKSFVVTMYDPNAPTQSGFWHWAVKDISANIDTLEENAGAINSQKLPENAVAMPMDARMNQYVGAAPSKGDAPHPYHITVTALDVEVLDISPESTPAFMNFNMIGHELARGFKIVYAKL